MMSANCPSCGGALKKMPQRKTKCPHCGDYMFIRSTPNDPTRRLVSAAAAEAIELAWQKRFAQKRVDDAAALFGLPPGMTANQLRGALMERVMNLGDHRTAMQAAVQLMALAESDLRREEAARWYYAHQLQDLGERGFAAVEIRAGLDACPACRAQHGRELAVGDALVQMVPSPDCEMFRTGRASCAFWSASLRGSPYYIHRTSR